MIFRFFSKFFTVIVVIVIVIVVFYGVCTIFANCQPSQVEYRLPSESKAQYMVIIKNTGNVLFTDHYITGGDIIMLYGYWELVEDKYVFRDNEISLDQAVFGTITIKER